ncbi:MAG: hypothetical protein ACYC35_08735 [Pirellulales bacterium]
MSQRRFAVVFGELFVCKDKLAVGHHVGRIPLSLVERVDGQGARDLDRLVLLSAVEHQPAAETAGCAAVLLGHDRVGPHGHDLHRLFELAVLALHPGDVLRKIELGATGAPGQAGKEEDRQELAANGHRSFLVTRGGVSRFRHAAGVRPRAVGFN